jgi:bifunctional non-homologous end joining protein LigD
VALEIYRKKRQFGVTPEPRGRRAKRGGNSYVIQKHAARRLHYDLRLELDGVMKSWAVTRGPSLDPGEKRLAVHVEDHPIDYNSFEGTIPAGEYGGGTVMIWDRGHWVPEGDPHRGYAKGHLLFDLEGEKLHGRWHLVRMQRRANDRHENWLLIKGKDDEARSGRDADILEQEPRSAATGRTMEEIAAGKGRKRVWHSNRASGGDIATRPQSQRAFRDELRAQAQAVAKGKAKTNAKTNAKTKPTAKAGAEPKSAPAKSTARAPAASAKRTKSAAGGVVAKENKKNKKNQKKSDPVPGGKSATATRLPDFVPPALATLHERPPSGPNWLHEIKLDGYRIEARLDSGDVQLLTRNRQDWTHRFAPIAAAVAKLPAKTAMLDGELVVEDGKGASSFSLLQIALKEGKTDRFVYWVFDILHLDGIDLTGRPLVERKAALAKLLRGAADPIRCAEHFDEDGPRLFKHACDLGLEGVISKRRDAPYSSGRTESFVKSKCRDEQELVVVGFTPSAAMPSAIGALTVGYDDNGALRYAGRVGTGYDHAIARDLWRRLQKLRAERPPLVVPRTERRKDVIWVKPQLLVEVEYRGITHDGLLRQAAYKGLREDKPAGEVVRETPVVSSSPAGARQAAVKSRAPAAKSTAARADGRAKTRSDEVAAMALTHPDRVYWADVGVTKQDLAEYYASIWDWMAPHVIDRPLALVRCPDGTKGECFFQKHIASNVKDSPVRHLVGGKEHDVIAVENLGDLIALVQSGALEIHVRGSRLGALEMCDRIVFDLDPGEGVTWKDIVAAARETRDRLAAEKLESFVKVSGGKGVHVVLPHAPVDWDTAKDFAQKIALRMAADSPQRYVGKMTKALRKGKIFIDYFRNSREATSVAAYSTRARAGAPVSVPLTWEQLARAEAANQFTVLNLKKSIRQDAWRDIDKVRQRLPSK